MKEIIKRIETYLKGINTTRDPNNSYHRLLDSLLAEGKITKRDLEYFVHSTVELNEEETEKVVHGLFIRHTYHFLDHLEIEDAELKSAEYLIKVLELNENAVLKHPDNQKKVDELIMFQSHLTNLDGTIDSEERTLKTRTMLILNITDDKYSEIESRIIKLKE